MEAPAGEALSRTKLMVNYIPECMSRDSMYSLFSTVGKVASCKLVANRGYGFVEFGGHEEAERARVSFDGMLLHGKTLKVSFALLNPEAKSDCNLYISNLPPETSLEQLNAIFCTCGPIASSRVAQGIAFVCYQARPHAEQAIQRFNGSSLQPGSVPLQVKFANRTRPQAAAPSPPAYPAAPGPHYNGELAALGPRYAAFPQTAALLPPPGKTLSFLNKGHQRFNPMAATNHLSMLAPVEPHRTSVYVYNIGEEIDELALWQLFGPYGAIDSIKVIKDVETKKNKGFAFINMRDYEEASQAIRALNGFAVNGQVLSVSFKTQKSK